MSQKCHLNWFMYGADEGGVAVKYLRKLLLKLAKIAPFDEHLFKCIDAVHHSVKVNTEMADEACAFYRYGQDYDIDNSYCGARHESDGGRGQVTPEQCKCVADALRLHLAKDVKGKLKD